MKQTLLQALVNPFGDLKSDSPDKIEKPKKAELDKRVELAYEKYKTIKYGGGAIERLSLDERHEMYREISNLGIEVLTPSQIALLVSKIADDPKLVNYLSHNLVPGYFISYVVQLSYNSGCNNFVLPTGEASIKAMLTEVGGTKEKPIAVSVHGHACSSFGEDAQYLNAEISGNTCLDVSDGAKYSNFIVHGNVGQSCGCDAEHCSFVIHGSEQGAIGQYAKNCRFTLEGKLRGIGVDAQKCTFMTHNYDTYKRMFATVPKRKGNKVILLK